MYPTQNNCSTKKELPPFQNEQELTKFLEQNFSESLKQLIRVTVNTMVKNEMETFRKEATEKFYFNGVYLRKMLSSFGRIDGIPIPRFRENSSGFNLRSLDVFDEEESKFAKLIEEMHLLGISQRKISHLSEVCFGVKISKNRVGAIYKELAEVEEMKINSQKLSDDFIYLILDGIWEKTKGYGWEDNDSVLLCALGVKANGQRKILGFSLARKEDYESWHELIENIKGRGLKGESLKLLIVDDNPAIKKTADSLFPKVKFQLCIVHKMRNVLKKTSHKNKEKIAKDLTEIFASENKKEAIKKTKKIVRKWYLTEPKAMASLRYNIIFCFTYMKFKRELWTKLRTTNLLEREFRELRRRMKVFDNTFQNKESANRYANTIFTYLNNNYPLSLHTKS